MIDTNFNITIECNTGELVTATWSYSKDCDNCDTWKIEHINSPSNSWIVTLTRNKILRSSEKRTGKYNMTISTVPFSAATEGSWECSYSMQPCEFTIMKKAHNYEKYGYLISEIILEWKGKSPYINKAYNISCRKTNGKFKQKLIYI